MIERNLNDLNFTGGRGGVRGAAGGGGLPGRSPGETFIAEAVNRNTQLTREQIEFLEKHLKGVQVKTKHMRSNRVHRVRGITRQGMNVVT